MTLRAFRASIQSILVIAFLLAVSCSQTLPPEPAKDSEDSQSVPVIAGAPARNTLTLTTTQPGKLDAFEQTPLFAKIAGYVEEVLVDIGDVVKKDQPLIRLSVPELRDDVAQRGARVDQALAAIKQAESTVLAAQAAAETAQASIAEAQAGIGRAQAEQDRWQSEYERIKELAARGSVTGKLEDETLSQMHSAQAATKEAEAKLLSANAAFRQAQADIEKSKADLFAAQSYLPVARADLDRAQTMLGYTQIMAPYDGTVTHRLVDTGHFVSPGDGSKPLMTMARMDIIRVFVDVPELEAAFVDIGDPATVQIPALRGHQFDGKVTRTSWALQESNRSLRVEIDIANPEGLLRPGMFATATIRLEQRPSAIALPSTAVLRDGEQYFCWSVRDGKIEHTPLQLGLRCGTSVEVISGVDENAKVVLRPPETLQPGQSVQVTESP